MKFKVGDLIINPTELMNTNPNCLVYIVPEKIVYERKARQI